MQQHHKYDRKLSFGWTISFYQIITSSLSKSYALWCFGPDLLEIVQCSFQHEFISCENTDKEWSRASQNAFAITYFKVQMNGVFNQLLYFTDVIFQLITVTLRSKYLYGHILICISQSLFASFAMCFYQSLSFKISCYVKCYSHYRTFSFILIFITYRCYECNTDICVLLV